METEARDEALGNPLIVSEILSLLQGHQSFLQCRLLNKFWDSEVLVAYPRREGLYLNVETYMTQKDLEEGSLLPAGSPLVAKVLAGGIYYDPENFLNFFKDEGHGGKVEVLLFNHHIFYKDWGNSWGDALYTILKNNWAPNLKEFIIDLYPDGSIISHVIGEQDFSGSLINLRVLEIRCSGWTKKTVKEGGFARLLKALLKGALSLETLKITGPFFPESAEVGALKNLKVFELDLYPNCVRESTMEIEQVLHALSKSCPFLEDLRLFLPQKGGQEQGTEGAIRFPRFPKLKKFSCKVNSGLPEGDFLRFLKEKMPVLRSCFVHPSGKIFCEKVEPFLRAHQSSRLKGEGVRFLSIPAPQPRDFSHLQGLGSRFPSLKGLIMDAWWNQNQALLDEHPTWLSDLALLLCQEFPFSSTISTGASIIECERAKERFLRAVGPQYKGTLGVFNLGSRNELRLTPEKTD